MRPRYRTYGSGVEWTDLERLRLEWFIENTRMSVREMAARVGRTRGATAQHLKRNGISVIETRYGEKEGSWAGV